MRTLLEWLGHHLASIAGFLLGAWLCMRLVRERRRPTVTLAWVVAVVLVPYVGVPLYLLLGGRKLRSRFPARSPAQVAGSGLEALLARESGFPACDGNELDWLLDGETAYRRLHTLLAEARSSIRVSIFLLRDDATGRPLVELLTAKAAAGVAVHLLVDDLGSMPARGGLLDPLRRAGGRVARFLPVLPVRRRWSANLRNHRKLAIVDGASAWTGGMNLAGEYLGPDPRPGRWIDGSVRVRGPVVAHLDEVFRRDWRLATDEELAPARVDGSGAGAGEARVQVVASGPDSPEDALSDGVLAALARARERVWLVTPYFIPDEPLARLLALQARLGCDVRLVLPRRSNHRLADLARTRSLAELTEAGVHVQLVEGSMVHAKAMVFDRDLAVFGTANLDLRSLYLNFELSLLVHSPADVESLAAWIDSIAARAGSPSTPLPAPRLVERVLGDLAALAAPLR